EKATGKSLGPVWAAAGRRSIASISPAVPRRVHSRAPVSSCSPSVSGVECIPRETQSASSDAPVPSASAAGNAESPGLECPAPVGMRFQHFVHHHRTTSVENSFLFSKHDAELRVVADCLSDHLLIALLEDVQWQLGPWKYDYLKWEQGQQLRLHATIIAFIRSDENRGKRSFDHRCVRRYRRCLRARVPEARRTAFPHGSV